MELKTVQEIERAIDALPPDQREILCEWLDEHYPDATAPDLRASIEAGRFDDRINRAVLDHKAGKSEPL